jgi:Zn-dependent protease
LASNLTLYSVSVWILPLLFAITFHEAAHGFVAHRLGDNTAWELGRVSFNPLRHIDPFGTILLPAMLLLSHSPFLFGYAKPVPVNFRKLRNPRLDMVWVALAGFGAVDRRQPQKRARYQCRAGSLQYDADPAA